VKDLDLWLAFAAFRAGDYQRAISVSKLYIYTLEKQPAIDVHVLELIIFKLNFINKNRF
jgi:hypothetical protein